MGRTRCPRLGRPRLQSAAARRPGGGAQGERPGDAGRLPGPGGGKHRSGCPPDAAAATRVTICKNRIFSIGVVPCLPSFTQKPMGRTSGPRVVAGPGRPRASFVTEADMVTEQQDFEAKWGDLVSRAGADDALKKRLLADPAAVLKEHGLIVPAGVTVKVVENTDKLIHLTLPQPPSAVELTEEELQAVAGGADFGCRGCGGCRSCGGCPGCRGCGFCRGLPGCLAICPAPRRTDRLP